MPTLWNRLQYAPPGFRWPIKWAIFVIVVFFVLYPHPGLFIRHVQHLRQLDALPDQHDPALVGMASRLDAFLAAAEQTDGGSPDLLSAVNTFVHREVRYAWDWDQWGVVDYVPTVSEVLASGREDCDGRAVLAAALLRSKEVEAHLVGDFRHVWVWTPVGETMGPRGEPAFKADGTGMHIEPRRLVGLGPAAAAVSVFPFLRELIILLTAWLLLLPPGVTLKRAALGCVILMEGLVVVRLAGADTARPNETAAMWGSLHLLAVIVLFWRKRRRGARYAVRSTA